MTFEKNHLSRLNPKQREAVLFGEGPLLILAGAGSGKTSTMAYRIAHLIAEKGVKANRILGLSFTRKASAELRERVIQLVSKTSSAAHASGLRISTFHSLCAKILRAEADSLGFDSGFTLLDQNDQIESVRQILRQIKIDDRKFDPASLLFAIGQTKNRFLEGEEAKNHLLENSRMPSDYSIAAASVYDRYQEKNRMMNAMDFDDLIFNTVKLFDEHPNLCKKYSKLFSHILVDEYQDTNPAQFRLLKLLTTTHQNICVVGDDDQSIYGWRGADSTHILEFNTHFPRSKIITLEQNYRSTATILDAANEMIKKNKKRHPKNLWSERGTGELIRQIICEEDRDESDTVAEEILKLQKNSQRPWRDFAILYRSNPQSRIFEESLRLRQIPYRLVGTLSFLDRKEIKDILSYWKLIVNPSDDAAARRVANWPTRGFGKSAFEATHQLAVKEGISFTEALSHSEKEGAKTFLHLLNSLREDLKNIELDSESFSRWGKLSLEKIGIKKGIETDCDTPEEITRRLDNAEELANSLGQLGVKTFVKEEKSKNREITGLNLLTEFISRMTLNALDEESDDPGNETEKDQVTLLTLHGAKGLEFPVVFVVGLEEGLIPHQKSIQEARDLSEERRLCYVGITRAKDHLILTRTKNRIKYGKKVPRYPSRFLEEIPKNLIQLEDRSASPDLSNKEIRQQHEVQVKNFLSAMRNAIEKS